MKPYILEIDDEALIEQLNKLDNAKETITKAIKSFLSANSLEENYEALMAAQATLSEKDADLTDVQRFSMDDVFEEADKRINNAHTAL